MRRQDWFYFAIVALCGSAAAQEVSTGFSPEIEVDPAHASGAALAQPEVNPDQSSVERLVVRGKERGSEGDDVAEETVPTATELEAVKTVDLLFYGSGRLRTTASSGELRIADNRSRLGVSGYKFVSVSNYIFTRIELGTDLGGTVDGLLLPSENPPDDAGTVFLRVGEVGVSTKWGDFSLGKQWSVYYDVSGYTDRFAVFGAQGTATYNAGTDGGGSGTGRADQALMYRTHGSSKLTLGLQLQNNGNIPLADSQKYNGAGGASLSYEFSPEWSAAAAYNHSVIKELDQELLDLGLTGDSQAAVLGVQYSHDVIYIATTIARHKNQETTNEGKYINANGWELYGRYQINKRIRAVAGANYLDPDKNDPDAGQYKIRAGILGMQYTYRDIKIGDIIYFEMELRGGRQVDGARSENAYTLGFRYSFEL